MTSKQLVFDLETNGIDRFETLAGLREIHCIGVCAPDGSAPRLFGPDEIEEGLDLLSRQSVLIGHNIVGFDIPVIRALYPAWECPSQLRDTLIYSRLDDPDRKNTDWGMPEDAALPIKLRGSHSLEAWGHRLKIHKAEIETDWDEFTPEMGEYCLQDVAVTAALWRYLDARGLSRPAAELEHEFAAVLQEQTMRGFAFDSEAATALYATLVERRDTLERDLQKIFPPAVVKMKTPQYWRDPHSGEQYSTKTSAPHKVRQRLMRGPLREKRIPFNPGSRSQIAQAFVAKYGWEPSAFTGDGKPKVDEVVLSALQYPEARPLAEYLMVTKRLGQLAEGREAYLKLEVDGRLHGKVNSYGTVTGRCTHSKPNLAQCVSVRAPYGKEFRSLFIADDGYQLMGVDASQLELRCLAHYMDDADYIQEILTGDIHSRNQAAAGLPTRDAAKTFAYAVCYGAGAHKLGQVVGGTAKEGARLRSRFLRNVPALGRLIEAVQHKAGAAGSVRGLLGHRIPVRSQHKALNALLQGAGATVMKVATVQMHRHFRDFGWLPEDVAQVAHIHDEVQFCVRKSLVEEVGPVLTRSIEETTKLLNLRCPMGGEFRVGRTWAETH